MKLKVIVFTSPEDIENEASKITELLDLGVDMIHIRKPDHSLREVKNLIEDIPYKYRRQLKLHGHFELLNEMNLAGVHLNHRNPKAPKNAYKISRSCHSIEEIKTSKSYDYVTLSPIYDSISKRGYKSKFDLNLINSEIKKHKIVALGGVRPDNFFELQEKGFFGAALLGYIWENDFNAIKKELKQAIEKL